MKFDVIRITVALWVFNILYALMASQIAPHSLSQVDVNQFYYWINPINTYHNVYNLLGTYSWYIGPWNVDIIHVLFAGIITALQYPIDLLIGMFELVSLIYNMITLPFNILPPFIATMISSILGIIYFVTFALSLSILSSGFKREE